ncbi:hypothetical protein B9Z55_018556 [Caenorhabditis nigoni]|uniref:Uncharacterized protein n=1 Tax=Caenorhabditis nigoni TaxID=1611254 RepID=A0A2G5TFC3_9PELO|nr:hypothetical protein B9Z55_018556 [Caenorhabditis nigoni]
MNRKDELNKFAEQKEKESKDKLEEYRKNIAEKMATCIGLREHLPVNRHQNESNKADQEIQEFHSDLNGILEFYDEQLDRIGHASKRIENLLRWDNNVTLEDSKSQEYYMDIIETAYDSVVKHFIETGCGVTDTCKLIVDTADEKRLNSLGILGKIVVPMSMVAKFLLHVQRISDILIETLEQIDIRDAPPSNPNDSNQCDEACAKLKNLANGLVSQDHEIKSSCCHLLETIYDSYVLSEELMNHFASFLRKYYELNSKYGIVHFNLYGYKSPELAESPLPTKASKQKEHIQDYLKEVNSLRAEVQGLINSVVQEARKPVVSSFVN